MSKPGPLLAAVGSIVLAVSAFAAEPQAWEFQNGRWIQATTQAASTQPVTDATLDWAEDLLSRGQYKPARGVLIRWLKTHQQHPLRDRALYLVAEAHFQKGDRVRAFYYLDELMDKYPDSALHYRALDKQYQIADAYLRGFKRKFLGFRIIGAQEEAIEMLYRVQQRSPGSPVAEKALLRTADYYYATSQFDLAGDAYAAYARSYPRSPVLPKVRLREAFCSLARFRGLRYDSTPLLDARAQLVDIVGVYPELAEEENLPTVLTRIDSSFARKIYQTADFYRRTHDLKSAAYHYRFLIKSFPNSPEAQRAERDLSQLPQRALDVPEPGAAAGYGNAPTTQEAR
jgi:outer membrane assembly lipoprotein YfiO